MTTQPELVVATLFRKSSYSNGGDNCVEVGLTGDGRVAVRNSKHPELLVHLYTSEEWAAFLAGAKAGEFDL
ncbi:DUF397 domain-containing protein [Actinoalloteichus caeruleus]|uniref:DUF397 domain-containing protein n=1 Tax=Actinoalloteichus cyanogriseus TaxID=2893586 RepID=UPI003AAD0C46